MAPDTMRVRLHLRLIRVLTVLVDSVDRLEIVVVSTWSWSQYPFCGFKTRIVPDTRRLRLRDLPVSERLTALVWIRRRFVCGNCDERHLETHVAFEGGLTRRLVRQLVTDAKDVSIRAVVLRRGLDWHLIQALVASWAATVAEHRRSRVLWWTRPLCANVTVLQDGDTGQSLAMVAYCNAAALSALSSSKARNGAVASRLPSATDRSPTAAPSRPISAGPVTCWTGSMSCAGSPTP